MSGGPLWLGKSWDRGRQGSDFPVAQMVKNLPAMQKTWVPSLGQEDPLEKGMTIHPSIFAWRIPRTEEPGGLQSVVSQRVRHDWVTNTFAHIFWGGRKQQETRGSLTVLTILVMFYFLKNKNCIQQVCQKVSISKSSHPYSNSSQCLKYFLITNSCENILSLGIKRGTVT